MRSKSSVFLCLTFPVIALLILASCSGDPKPQKPRVFEGYGMWMDTIMKSQDKILRGLEPGMTLEEVKKAENIQALEEDSCSLYYEIAADSLTNTTLTYSFTANKLSEVEMSIHSKTAAAGTEVFNDLKKYFDQKYPNPVSEKGVLVYSAKNSAGQAVKISIEDLSGMEDGQVNLLIYCEQ